MRCDRSKSLATRYESDRQTYLAPDLASDVRSEANDASARAVPKLHVGMELLDTGLGSLAFLVFAPLQTTPNTGAVGLVQRLVIGRTTGV